MQGLELSSVTCSKKNLRVPISLDVSPRMEENIESTSESSPLIEQTDEQRKNTEFELGMYTLNSHGAEVACKHMHNWLVLVLLIVIKAIIHFVPPFYRFVGKDMMTYLTYPLKSNTVPMWVVQVCSTLLPVVIFLIFYKRRRDVYDLHHATLGLLFSILLTSVVTDTIKYTVGRPRPDFFWRCFPNGKDVYDHLGNVLCHGDKHIIREGYKSFPSGHTSWAFAGTGFLSLYLSGKIKLFDRKGHVAKICIILLPLLFACLVGISRVDDYWHHWEDVFVGACLGLAFATFFYLQLFPPPHSPQGCRPYAYFQALEESRASVNAKNATNTINADMITSPETADASYILSRAHLSSQLAFAGEDVERGRR